MALDVVLLGFGAGSDGTGAGWVGVADGGTGDGTGVAGTSLRWRLRSRVTMSYRNGLELPVSRSYSTFHAEI